MLAQVYSCGLLGIDGYIVTVEADTTGGLPSFNIVGLPDSAVRESKERVRVAINNSEVKFPSNKRIVVNLSPADVKKEGTLLDLPIAVSIIGITNQVPPDKVKEYLIVGELSLDGAIKPIKGAISIAFAAKEAGFKGVILPSENAKEGAVVKGIDVYPVTSLFEVISFLRGEFFISPCKIDIEGLFRQEARGILDFCEVKGQPYVKRALEIAAAGRHNVLMIGSPGCGKTMLAKRLPTILPELSLPEAIETTKIHSIAGLMDGNSSLMTTRPFRAPHHTVSDAGLVGGGQIPKPGEISLSHNGVLFLDELPEFPKNVLEALRQPLEDGCLTISRASISLSFPASFMLIGAMNPCPCGYFSGNENNISVRSNASTKKECHCTPIQIQKYLRKISGPLLDRIDIHVEVSPLEYKDLEKETSQEESSLEIRARVNQAVEIQKNRFEIQSEVAHLSHMSTRIYANSRMGSKEIQKWCRVTDEGKKLMRNAIDKLGFSARAYDRILKISRTIADLEGVEHIKPEHISEAVGYRTLDRNWWE